MQAMRSTVSCRGNLEIVLDGRNKVLDVDLPHGAVGNRHIGALPCARCSSSFLRLPNTQQASRLAASTRPQAVDASD